MWSLAAATCLIFGFTSSATAQQDTSAPDTLCQKFINDLTATPMAPVAGSLLMLAQQGSLDNMDQVMSQNGYGALDWSVCAGMTAFPKDSNIAQFAGYLDGSDDSTNATNLTQSAKFRRVATRSTTFDGETLFGPVLNGIYEITAPAGIPDTLTFDGSTNKVTYDGAHQATRDDSSGSAVFSWTGDSGSTYSISFTSNADSSGVTTTTFKGTMTGSDSSQTFAGQMQPYDAANAKGSNALTYAVLGVDVGGSVALGLLYKAYKKAQAESADSSNRYQDMIRNIEQQHDAQLQQAQDRATQMRQQVYRLLSTGLDTFNEGQITQNPQLLENIKNGATGVFNGLQTDPSGNGYRTFTLDDLKSDAYKSVMADTRAQAKSTITNMLVEGTTAQRAVYNQWSATGILDPLVFAGLNGDDLYLQQIDKKADALVDKFMVDVLPGTLGASMVNRGQQNVAADKVDNVKDLATTSARETQTAQDKTDTYAVYQKAEADWIRVQNVRKKNGANAVDENAPEAVAARNAFNDYQKANQDAENAENAAKDAENTQKEIAGNESNLEKQQQDAEARENKAID